MRRHQGGREQCAATFSTWRRTILRYCSTYRGHAALRRTTDWLTVTVMLTAQHRLLADLNKSSWLLPYRPNSRPPCCIWKVSLWTLTKYMPSTGHHSEHESHKRFLQQCPLNAGTTCVTTRYSLLKDSFSFARFCYFTPSEPAVSHACIVR